MTTFQTFRSFNAPLSILPYPKATQALGKDYWVVTVPFVYYVGAKGSNITVEIPVGYMTDGATNPFDITRKLIPPFGEYGQATVVHDYLCEYLTVKVDGVNHAIGRERADKIFLEAMEVLEVNVIKRHVMYWAVCLWRIYKKIDKPKPIKKKFLLEEEYRRLVKAEEPSLPVLSEDPPSVVLQDKISTEIIIEETIHKGETVMPTYPSSPKDKAIAALKAEMAANGITTPKAQAMLLAQCDHESGGFKRLEENLNYRVDTLMKISATARKKGRPACEEAVKKGPMAIAELMYGGRMGNDQPGDGWKYRGRGFIQLTGKTNYRDAGTAMGVDLVNTPDLASTPEGAAKIAVWFFKKYVAAKGSNGDVKAATLAINGGDIGLEDRAKKYDQYLAQITNPVNTGNVA